MKISEQDIINIAGAIADKRDDLFSESSYNRITNMIFDGWENWSEDIIESYYEGDKKPEEPTHYFRFQYVINELQQIPENWEDLIDSFK